MFQLELKSNRLVCAEVELTAESDYVWHMASSLWAPQCRKLFHIVNMNRLMQCQLDETKIGLGEVQDSKCKSFRSI